MPRADPIGNAGKIPVTVLTGYLGAGKTTLLNRILADPRGRRFAVIVNEFGELGIDADLVVGVEEEVITLANGCLCCNVRGDLLRTLRSILSRDAPLDGVLIETTGLADPAPVAQTFFMDAEVTARTRLDAIVTLVDARHFPACLGDRPEIEAQVAAADLVLLNKSDLVTADELDRVEAGVRACNRFAEIRRTTRSALSVDGVLDRRAFDLSRVLEHVPGFLDGAARHDRSIESASFEADRPLAMDRFLRWADSLTTTEGDNLLRIKGVLAFEGQDRWFAFQAVHRITEGGFLDERPVGTNRSKLVIIGRHLDRERLGRNLRGCQIPLRTAASPTFQRPDSAASFLPANFGAPSSQRSAKSTSPFQMPF